VLLREQFVLHIHYIGSTYPPSFGGNNWINRWGKQETNIT